MNAFARSPVSMLAISRSGAITINQECKIRITAHPKDSKQVRKNNIQFTIESLADKSFEHYIDLEGILRNFLNFVINDGVVLQSFITAYEDYREEFKESFPMLDEAKYFIRKPKAIEDLVNHVSTLLG